jgi:tetratricopeptide (TPR) repeat protein
LLINDLIICTQCRLPALKLLGTIIGRRDGKGSGRFIVPLLNPTTQQIRFFGGSMGIFDRFKSSTVAKLEGLTATDWIAKGQVLDRSDRYAEAIECYDKALEIDPRSGAWWWKGKTLYKLGRFQEALQCYDKSLETNPSFY